jgi:hypothetical protein
MRGLAVFVLVVVMVVDTDKRVEVKDLLTGEIGPKQADAGEATTEEGMVGVGVEAVIEDFDGEKGGESEESEGLEERVGERRSEAD